MVGFTDLSHYRVDQLTSIAASQTAQLTAPWTAVDPDSRGHAVAGAQLAAGHGWPHGNFPAKSYSIADDNNQEMDNARLGEILMAQTGIGKERDGTSKKDKKVVEGCRVY